MLANKPENKTQDEYWHKYDAIELDAFFDSINFETASISNMSLNLRDSGGISQDKLREAGFKIKRNKFEADIIVISDIRLLNYRYSYSSKEYIFHNNIGKKISEFIDEIIFDEQNAKIPCKYILLKDLYKYIYKYTGDFDLYKSCDELFDSNDENNSKMAMEFISNANWTGNEIYLKELFNNHYDSRMRRNQYKTSISFKGFLNSLDFAYKYVNYYQAAHYAKDCLNDEHHNFVYDKFKERFEESLKGLIQSYKIKIDKIEYSIDKRITDEDDEDTL
jgi:hypothetical protein